MLEGWTPATYDALGEWADDLGFRCETSDHPDGNQRLTINGAVSVEFRPWSRLARCVTVTWGGEAGGEFSRGLPLTALTSLVGGLLAVGAGEGALGQCRCGITPGAPSEVIPLACPVHGAPCSSCGGLESCKPDCNGEDPEELLAAIDEAEVIGTVTDALGDFVKVGVVRLAPVKPAVLIGVSGSPGILDTPERRDEFARYYMEACRQAEAVEAVQAAGTEG